MLTVLRRGSNYRREQATCPHNNHDVWGYLVPDDHGLGGYLAADYLARPVASPSTRELATHGFPWGMAHRRAALHPGSAPPATTAQRQAAVTGSGKSISLGKTNAAILNGDEDVSLWTDEELLRGQRKGKNGRWTGRKPKVVPTAVHHELTRRRMGQAYELMREDLVAAVQVLGSIVKDTEASNRDRLRAAELIMDRVLGKATERVEVKLAPEPWEQLLVGSVVDLPIETTGVEDG